MTVSHLMEEYLLYLENIDKSERTVSEHKRYLKGPILRALGDAEISELRIIDRALVIREAKQMGKTGPQRAIVTFRCYLRYLHEAGIKIPFRWDDIEVPKYASKPVESLTTEELGIIRNVLDLEDPTDLRMRVLLELLLHTGMRISEALSVDINNIDFLNEEIIIANPKADDELQKVYISGCIDWLKHLINSRTDDNPALFVINPKRSRHGELRRLGKITAKGHMIRFRKRLHTTTEIKKHINYHIFRKTYCTHLLNSGVNIKRVQRLARHKSERTTMRYYISVNDQECKLEHNRVMCTL